MKNTFISVLFLATLPQVVDSHGRMTIPPSFQPEPMYWYQVGCLAGCTCSGGGKETYPTPASMNCKNPTEPTLKATDRTWNIQAKSPEGDWNKYMPWRAPGTSIPLDSCGIASGFSPDANVQFPHKFAKASGVVQGDKGSALASKTTTSWVAGSTVQAAFTLSVNHGGGYQYRVCPRTIDGKAQTIDEACFENNPLKFADSIHTVTFADGKANDVEIPALDVSEGVQPSGHAWRRLPLPACNCDLGSGCNPDSTSNDYKAYATKDASAFGNCKNGLQFTADYLTDGTWADGYGYYLESLGRDTSKSPKSKTDDACAKHGDETKCKADATCAWYDDGSKNVCYTNAGKTSSDTCDSAKEEGACAQNAEGCTWYAPKSLCYKKGKKRSLEGLEGDTYGVGTQEMAQPNWQIVDNLIAPSVLGKYVLQWRWGKCWFCLTHVVRCIVRQLFFLRCLMFFYVLFPVSFFSLSQTTNKHHKYGPRAVTLQLWNNLWAGGWLRNCRCCRCCWLCLWVVH